MKKDAVICYLLSSSEIVKKNKLLAPELSAYSLLVRERRLQKHEAVKSFGGSGVSMMNGRWVETNEIFEKMPASRNSEELGNNGDSSILNLNPPPSREALIFATCTTSKDQDHQNCQVKSWKEIRFREVLLSQTDPELSLIQVHLIV